MNIGRTCRLIEEIGHNDIDITFKSNLKDSELSQVIEHKLDFYINKMVIFYIYHTAFITYSRFKRPIKI